MCWSGRCYLCCSSHKNSFMALLTLLNIFSVAFTDLSKGRVVLPDDHLNATVGGNVTFTLDLKSFKSIEWIKVSEKNVRIIFSDSTATIISPEYKDRVTFFTSTGSLELRNVSLHDSGRYVANIVSQSEGGLIKRTVLKVEDVPGVGGSKCDTGCISEIVVVFLLLLIVLVLVVLVVLVVKKRKRICDWIYAERNNVIFRNRNGGEVELGRQNGGSAYAEVQVNS